MMQAVLSYMTFDEYIHVFNSYQLVFYNDRDSIRNLRFDRYYVSDIIALSKYKAKKGVVGNYLEYIVKLVNNRNFLDYNNMSITYKLNEEKYNILDRNIQGGFLNYLPPYIVNYIKYLKYNNENMEMFIIIQDIDIEDVQFYNLIRNLETIYWLYVTSTLYICEHVYNLKGNNMVTGIS